MIWVLVLGFLLIMLAVGLHLWDVSKICFQRDCILAVLPCISASQIANLVNARFGLSLQPHELRGHLELLVKTGQVRITKEGHYECERS